MYQPFILLAHLTTLIVLGAVNLDATGLVLVVAALPALGAGTWLGWQIYGRLNEAAFRRFLAALLLLSGLTLIR